MRVWMRFGEFGDGGVGEVVVVGVADDDGVDDGYVFDGAWLGRVALWLLALSYTIRVYCCLCLMVMGDGRHTFGPMKLNGEHLGSNTGSKRTRSPLGNSTK